MVKQIVTNVFILLQNWTTALSHGTFINDVVLPHSGGQQMAQAHAAGSITSNRTICNLLDDDVLCAPSVGLKVSSIKKDGPVHGMRSWTTSSSSDVSSCQRSKQAKNNGEMMHQHCPANEIFHFQENSLSIQKF
jgi:hypothetical protein